MTINIWNSGEEGPYGDPREIETKDPEGYLAENGFTETSPGVWDKPGDHAEFEAKKK